MGKRIQANESERQLAVECHRRSGSPVLSIMNHSAESADGEITVS
jgi:hypothetical protein